MYNNNNSSSSSSPPMSPRISFSNDFLESSHNNNTNNSRNLVPNSSRSSSPGSSDFEFCVSNDRMMSADELFFKGRILPFSFKDNDDCGGSTRIRTLRDELLVDDDHHNHHQISSLKPPKHSSSSSSNGWKGFLGLRQSHIGSKKPDKIDSNPKSSQGMVSSEGPSSTDMEVGILI